MKITFFLAACLMIMTSLRADDAVKLPASEKTAAEALKSSTRHGEWMDVEVDGQKVKSWVVYPERKEKAGVVIVIHEIFGLSDWVRAVADQFAAEGFIAVAPDLLSGKGPNGGGTDSFAADSVRKAVSGLDKAEVVKRLDAVREAALKFPAANGKSGSIGFCWGGGASFNYAANQPKLNAAVVYYGSPPEKAAMEKIACPVLGCYGGDDARITATVEPTKQAMSELNKSYTPLVFEGAGHGFLRQQEARPANLDAAKKGWAATLEFLRKNRE
jgi:carboxymethylenebutenolidase